MYIKLNYEKGAEFAAYVRANVRGSQCKKRENVSTTAMNIALWTAMNVCFTTGSLNRTFPICHRSIATATGRSERWIYTIMKRLQEAGYLEKLCQRVYAKDKYGPNIYRLGRRFKAIFFAFCAKQTNSIYSYVKNKKDANYLKKQTSDFNLKKGTTSVVDFHFLEQYSFIPDFKSFIKSLG